jgi:hypothetical protein
LYHVIRPDDLQRTEIDPILEKYAGKIHESVVRSREDMSSIGDEMMEELEPFLNDDQLFRMRKAHERMGRGWGDYHRPGPPHKKGRRPGNRR